MPSRESGWVTHGGMVSKLVLSFQPFAPSLEYPYNVQIDFAEPCLCVGCRVLCRSRSSNKPNCQCCRKYKTQRPRATGPVGRHTASLIHARSLAAQPDENVTRTAAIIPEQPSQLTRRATQRYSALHAQPSQSPPRSSAAVLAIMAYLSGFFAMIHLSPVHGAIQHLSTHDDASWAYSERLVPTSPPVIRTL